jgi:hypothetical protein
MDDVSISTTTQRYRVNESTVKYLSGLIDADGSISFNFSDPSNDKNSQKVTLKVSLAASDAVDVHGFVLDLPYSTGFGSSSRFGEREQFTRWVISSRRDLEMVIPRLVKHMAVKARHFQRMFEKWKEVRGKVLSEAECDELREFSKSSRSDAGPLKPKNFPARAWMAGYLDGNGCFRSGRCKSGSRNGKAYDRMQCSVQAACHINDACVLEFIQKAYGGYIKKHSASDNCMVWERNLGKSQRSFALKFLPDMVNHSRLKKHKIEQMIAFHHQQRPSVPTPAGEAMA